MQKNTEELYTLVDRALDEAMVNGRFLFKMYPYLKAQNGHEEKSMTSLNPVAAELSNAVLELEGYIKGGDAQLRESYGHIPKPKARKIKTYLYSILEDAWKYHAERNLEEKVTK